ncbi:hypothetical protein COV13_00935 [Candidatus Woesearchaeota archaeon CG10_big_fil_rev_8_21_14_0_10_32_9]|nr:MAG: hypothetical protein COV13_00935 [Candidatus Woesearchaeota archaeon CG10_big_fil_rev_8_21_14_0_10_32_9]
MKINVLENTSKKLTFFLEDADHTFCNALKDELRNNDAVSVSSYNISHPLVGKPKFIVETTGSEKPKDALDKAIAGLKKKNLTFLKAFESLK